MGDVQCYAVWSAVVYTMLGVIDGIWLHLWLYKLHRVAPGEHAVHTARAVLLVPVLCFMVGHGSGIGLWCAVLCALIDVVLVAGDAAVEHQSRHFQQGVPAFEAALHTVLQAVYVLMLAAGVAAKPAEAWSLTIPDPHLWLHPRDGILVMVVAVSVLFAVVHVYLLLHERKRRSHIVAIARI